MATFNIGPYTFVTPTGTGAGGFMLVPVVRTLTPGDIVHATTTSPDTLDLMSLWANNISNAAVLLTIEFGGVAVADQIVVSIPSRTVQTEIFLDRPLQPGVEVRAFAGTTVVINLSATIKRYSVAP